MQNNRVKRLFATAITFAMTLSLLVGCGANSSDATGEKAAGSDSTTVDSTATVTDTSSTKQDDPNASFVKNGVKGIWMEMGEVYDYTICGYKDGQADTSATGDAYVRPLSYEIQAEYNGMNADDGYEWRVLSTVILIDVNNNQNGVYYRSFTTDYNNTEAAEASWVGGEEYDQFNVTYNDKEYTCKYVTSTEWTRMIFNSEALITTAVMVPVGYDGIVFGLYNPTKGNPNDDSEMPWDVADDATVWYRLGNDNTGKLANTVPYFKLDLNVMDPLQTTNSHHEMAAVYDATADYENKTFINPHEKTDGYIAEDYIVHEFDKYETVPSIQTITDRKVTNGVAMFSVFSVSSSSSATASGASAGTPITVIFDLNRGIVHKGDLYVDPYYEGIGWSDGDYRDAVAYPIVYEADGGIDLSKNWHWTYPELQ